MTTIQKLLYSDSISILDFALFLEKYNSEIGDFIFFSNLIYDAIEAGKLTPLLLPFNYTTPFRERDFKFSPETLINWSETKKFKIEYSKINESSKSKWLAASHYMQEWQTTANILKKKNPRWKKSDVATAIHNEILLKHPDFPHSPATIERQISIKVAKNSQ